MASRSVCKCRVQTCDSDLKERFLSFVCLFILLLFFFTIHISLFFLLTFFVIRIFFPSAFFYPHFPIRIRHPQVSGPRFTDTLNEALFFSQHLVSFVGFTEVVATVACEYFAKVSVALLHNAGCICEAMSKMARFLITPGKC